MGGALSLFLTHIEGTISSARYFGREISPPKVVCVGLSFSTRIFNEKLSLIANVICQPQEIICYGRDMGWAVGRYVVGRRTSIRGFALVWRQYSFSHFLCRYEQRVQ